MKKTALTLVAFAFGIGVAFAQTTPQTEEPAVNTEETVATDNMSNTSAEDSGLRTIEVSELPAAVQEALKGEEFSALTVLAVAEVSGQADSKSKFFQAALAQDPAATSPSLIVLFNEEGKAVARKDMAAEQQGE